MQKMRKNLKEKEKVSKDSRLLSPQPDQTDKTFNSQLLVLFS